MARNKISIERLTGKDLEELSRKRDKGGVFFSLYVGIRPGRNFVSEANSVISEKVQRIKKAGSYSASAVKRIEKVTKIMKDEIRLLKIPDETRSVAMFCGAEKFGKFYHMPVYIPSKFVIESDFYIHPIVESIESHPKYLVLVLERDKARFFNFFMGEIEKISEIISSEVPQRINAARASWKGLSESNVQSHIRDHENRHLKKVCNETENYFRFGKNGRNYLIIGAHKELVGKYAKMLGEKSKNKLIGSYPITPNYKIEEIKRKSQKVMEEHEKLSEEKLIDEIINGAGNKKNSAVLSIDSVLENLYLHNVETFVLGRNYIVPGYLCPACHYISSYRKICPKNNIGMINVDDLVDEIIEEAIANKIKIKHLLFPHAKFDKFGIGAILKSSK